MEVKGGAVKVRNAEERGRRSDDAVLITGAAPSYAEQYAQRRRKYMLLMGSRFPCLILAGIFYQTWWLALTFVILSVPLPWMAVLIANDRPPRKSEHMHRYRVRARELEATEHRVVDS